MPGFLHSRTGEFWTRLSYSYQGEFWNSLSAIRCVNTFAVNNNCDDAGLTRLTRTTCGRRRSACTVLWAEYAAVRRVVQYTAGTPRSSSATCSTRRRLSLELVRLRRIFRRSAVPLPATPQRPRTSASRSPSDGDRLRHGLSPCLRSPGGRRRREARHDLGRARQPPGRKPRRRLPHRPRQSRGQADRRLE